MSANTIAMTTGMDRVAIQKPRFFRVRVNSNPTTVPWLCRAKGRFGVGPGRVSGVGEGLVIVGCVMGVMPPPVVGFRRRP